MIAAALSVLVVFMILVISEWLWRIKKLRGEFDRKFVHITVGSFVAFWPFYMSFHYIQLISLAFLAVVIASHALHIFKAVYTIKRRSWGDYLFAVGIGLSALLTTSRWIFMAAILNLALADGLAAVLGKRFGAETEYKVWGHTKSFIGSVTFWLTSTIILLTVLSLGTKVPQSSIMLIICLPLVATVVENTAVLGFDNVLVPLLVVLVLRLV